MIEGNYQRVPWKARHPEDMLASDFQKSYTVSPSSYIQQQSPTNQGGQAFTSIQQQQTTFDSSQGFQNFKANSSIYSGNRSSTKTYTPSGSEFNQRRGVRTKFKEVDYSDITRSMLEKEKMRGGDSSKPQSRGLVSSSHQSKRFGSIDTKFKQQIDLLKRRKAMEQQS